nr:hypothetical protein [Tanacetum cinerariifolium]
MGVLSKTYPSWEESRLEQEEEEQHCILIPPCSCQIFDSLKGCLVQSSQQWHIFSSAGGTFFTSSGNFFWQWELITGKEYFDEVHEDDENNHLNGNVVKRGITRISRKHKALFLSFLGDMVREHIGLKILSWKKRYFDVDLSVINLVKSAAVKMARSKFVYQHTMRRGGYVLVKEKMLNFTSKKKEIEPYEEPARGTLWLKGRVNKDREYLDDEIRSGGDKLKETKGKIKEGTLKVDHGTDAMTVVIGKEKGSYARGVKSGVTYKRYFDLPRSRHASDERILLLQSQLDNERREHQEKELLIH